MTRESNDDTAAIESRLDEILNKADQNTVVVMIRRDDLEWFVRNWRRRAFTPEKVFSTGGILNQHRDDFVNAIANEILAAITPMRSPKAAPQQNDQAPPKQRTGPVSYKIQILVHRDLFQAAWEAKWEDMEHEPGSPKNEFKTAASALIEATRLFGMGAAHHFRVVSEMKK